MRVIRLSVVALLFGFSIGCAPSGPKTYPVNGRLEILGGDVSVLAGSHVEAGAGEGDPNVRASGEIQADGTFTLETLHGGSIHKGAQAGEYKVRIILTDDDRAVRKRASKAIDPRVLKFDSSGLSVQVPSVGDVNLAVPKR